MAQFEKFEKLLARLDCHSPLIRSKENVLCQKRDRLFPLEPGVLILLGNNSQKVLQKEVTAYSTYDHDSRKNWLKRLLPLPNLVGARPTLHDMLKEKYILWAPPESVILNCDIGVQHRFYHPFLINLNVYPQENADVAADAQQLPFLDNSLDGIWFCAVIEHLSRPFDVAVECFRVCKNNRFVLITIPFIQLHYGSPHDYLRYTVHGLRICVSPI